MIRTKTERRLPFVVAGIALVTIGGFLSYCDTTFSLELIAIAAMTFGVVVAGFSATQRNMLFGMGASRILRFAGRTGYYKQIALYLRHGVFAGLSASSIGVVGLFVDGESRLLRSVWLTLLSSAIVLVISILVRNEILMFRITKRFMEEQGKR